MAIRFRTFLNLDFYQLQPYNPPTYNIWRKGRVNRVYCYIRLNQQEDRAGDLRRKLDDFILTNQIYIYEIVVEIISSSTLAESRVKFSRLLEEVRTGDILITMRYLQDCLETRLFYVIRM